MESRDAKRLAASQEGKKVGDAGYRYHARVPRAAQPAYVNAPQVSEAVRSLHPYMRSCTIQVDSQSPPAVGTNYVATRSSTYCTWYHPVWSPV